MKSCIAETIGKVRQAGGSAFIPYLTAGFPDDSTCLDLLTALGENGADVIEIGLPFSDPLADGPTIQMSSRKALDNGITVQDVFNLAAKARERLDCPLILMTYCNPVFRRGPATFAAQAKESGIDGVIIPDLPVDEADDWLEAAERQDLDTIFLVAPTTTTARLRQIASKTGGFLYYVSMTGVTGSACTVSDEMLAHVRKTQAASPVPVAVGFGISEPDQARTLARVADGVIVGSAFIRTIAEEPGPAEQVAAVSRLAASLSAALKSPS
jgi:tryptophan synthase alpha chain